MAARDDADGQAASAMANLRELLAQLATKPDEADDGAGDETGDETGGGLASLLAAGGLAPASSPFWKEVREKADAIRASALEALGTCDGLGGQERAHRLMACFGRGRSPTHVLRPQVR